MCGLWQVCGAEVCQSIKRGIGPFYQPLWQASDKSKLFNWTDIHKNVSNCSFHGGFFWCILFHGDWLGYVRAVKLSARRSNHSAKQEQPSEYVYRLPVCISVAWVKNEFRHWIANNQQLCVFKTTFKFIATEAAPLLAWLPALKAPVLSRFACQVSTGIVLF